MNFTDSGNIHIQYKHIILKTYCFVIKIVLPLFCILFEKKKPDTKKEWNGLARKAKEKGITAAYAHMDKNNKQGTI